MQKELEIAMDEDNPYPLVQPFLKLIFLDPPKAAGKKDEKFYTTWYIDVNGDVGRYFYLDNIEFVPSQGGCQTALVLLKKPMDELIANLKKNGLNLKYLGTYQGSNEATHILRNGVFFKRIS